MTNTNRRISFGIFEWFVRSEVRGSVLLLAATVLALLWANSPWADLYHEISHMELGVSFGDRVLALSLAHWVADGLMAIFFFVVGLEIKREFVLGELSTFKQAVLPVSAAIGGMLVPAVIFYSLNAGQPTERGWGVPMATDIAFALGILALFGKRVPIGLKVFLTALAIVDDLGAILVIAIFYTEHFQPVALELSLVFLGMLFLVRSFGIRQNWVYAVLTFACWAATLASGIHATVAGVLMALIVPVRATLDPRAFFREAKGSMEYLEKDTLTRESMVHNKTQQKALESLYFSAEGMIPPAMFLEHNLQPIQAFIILPLFALFKAGVPLDAGSLGGVTGQAGLGIMLGLFVGKQLGVFGFSWLAVRSGRAVLPTGVNWGQLWGGSILAGVGFTMSIFISELAFIDKATIGEAKLAILVASSASALFGLLVLSRALPREGQGG